MTMGLDLTADSLRRQSSLASWRDPGRYWPTLTALTAGLSAPLAVLHAPALLHNARQLAARAAVGAGADRTPPTIRVGSKSVRCVEIQRAVLGLPGFAGTFCYTLAEAVFLRGKGFDDIVVGYPSADRAAIARLLADDGAAASITVMIDSPAQLDLIDAVVAPERRPDVRVCLDLDLSLDLPGPLPRIGVWRSPLHRPEELRRLAETVLHRPGFVLDGLLGYEAQIAGVADSPAGRPLRAAAVQRMQKISRKEVAERRAAAVQSVRELTALRFVNGGGSGSVESTAAEDVITEITAGSALTAPHLFDDYRTFDPAPATAFALDVVRLPGPGRATLLGGGWVASGPVGPDRLPKVAWPTGTAFETLEGVGEVQTPLRTRGVPGAGLNIGDRVWLRHAKGGELAEHVNDYLVLDDERVLGTAPTYRGEGRAFL